jgi:hypothetical protein
MAYRPEFEAALALFAKASDRVREAGYARPILVGGAAVEIYTQGHFATSDLDVVTPVQDVFERALFDLGFVKPSGPNTLTRGVIHPELEIGIEIVGSVLMDGRASRERGITVLMSNESGPSIDVIGVEDLIADRMGQDASYPQGRPEMRGQAVRLYQLAVVESGIDTAYLDRRIQEETSGRFGLDDLVGFAKCVS